MLLSGNCEINHDFKKFYSGVQDEINSHSTPKNSLWLTQKCLTSINIDCFPGGALFKGMTRDIQTIEVKYFN